MGPRKGDIHVTWSSVSTSIWLVWAIKEGVVDRSHLSDPQVALGHVPGECLETLAGPGERRVAMLACDEDFVAEVGQAEDEDVEVQVGDARRSGSVS